MTAIHFGSQSQPTINWSRRRFLIGSTAAGITLALVPLAAHASFVDDETMPAAPGWSGDGFGHPRYRIDGYAKATGAKLYARDFRAADMDGWPDETDHAMLLLASDATHRFVGTDLTMLAPDLQPDRVVTAEDLEAARIRAKGYFTEDLMCPKGQTPAYLGQPVALLIFRGLEKFVTARQILRGAKGVSCLRRANGRGRQAALRCEPLHPHRRIRPVRPGCVFPGQGRLGRAAPFPSRTIPLLARSRRHRHAARRRIWPQHSRGPGRRTGGPAVQTALPDPVDRSLLHGARKRSCLARCRQRSPVAGARRAGSGRHA